MHADTAGTPCPSGCTPTHPAEGCAGQRAPKEHVFFLLYVTLFILFQSTFQPKRRGTVTDTDTLDVMCLSRKTFRLRVLRKIRCFMHVYRSVHVVCAMEMLMQFNMYRFICNGNAGNANAMQVSLPLRISMQMQCNVVVSHRFFFL